jgi:hypothetical protein
VERFSQAYQTCRNVMTAGKFPNDWQELFDKTMRVGGLLGSHGPNPKHASGLDKPREKILAASAGQCGELLAGAAATAKTPDAAKQCAAQPAD